MQYSPPINCPPALHSVASAVAATRDNHTSDQDRFDVTKQLIPSPLEVGDTAYVLRSELIGTFYPGQFPLIGQFVVPEFFPNFVGRGRNSKDAFLDWRDQLHRQFQYLYGTRPFEMAGSEKATWELLESQIDVNAYRATTPLTIRQIGRVAARARPLPELIEWEDGHKEAVRLDQMPGQFAAYKPGQPFEAIVIRDSVDFRLLKVTHIQRLRSLPRMSDGEFNDLVHSIPTTRSLPDTDWE
jgi:hypothetical protein